MKLKLLSCLDKGVLDIYYNLNVSVHDSWASALSGGSFAQGRSGVVSLCREPPLIFLCLPPSDASLADSVRTCLDQECSYLL